MSQHRMEQEANRMFEEYLESMKPSNFQTRLSGVQGQQDLLNFFQKETGQRAGSGLDRLRRGRGGI